MVENKSVYMMVGIPGSGKSTWIRQNRVDDWVVISPDQILEERYGYEWTPERAAEAWAESYQRFGALLLEDKTMVWDATFTSPMMRSAILHIAKGIGYRVKAIFCKTNIDLCLSRNLKRDREPVPESTIRRMADSLIVPSTEEGFDEIQVVSTD